MRTSRRFQPSLNGLPSRIAPTSVAAAVSVAAAAISTADTDMPQTGIGSQTILAPPASSSSGTQMC